MVAALQPTGLLLVTPKFSLTNVLLAAAVPLASPGRCAAEDNYASVALQNDILLGNDGGGYSSGLFDSTLRVASPGEVGVAPLWLFAPAGNWLGMPNEADSDFGAAGAAHRDAGRHHPRGARPERRQRERAGRIEPSRPAGQQHGSLTFAYLLRLCSRRPPFAMLPSARSRPGCTACRGNPDRPGADLDDQPGLDLPLDSRSGASAGPPWATRRPTSSPSAAPRLRGGGGGCGTPQQGAHVTQTRPSRTFAAARSASNATLPK